MPEGTIARTCARRIAGTLLVASVGIVLLGVVASRPAPEDVPVPPTARPIRLDAAPGATRALPSGSAIPSRPGMGDALTWDREDGDQPTGACWVARAGGAPASCVCSAGTVEDLLTPDYLRTLLTAWRDGGLLTTSELKERLQEVDAACVRQDVGP